MQTYEEIDGINGTVTVKLEDLGNGMERVKFEHTVHPGLDQSNLPDTYQHRVICEMDYFTRVVEYVDVVRGRFVPTGVATNLTKKYLGSGWHAEWHGRGWIVELTCAR